MPKARSPKRKRRRTAAKAVRKEILAKSLLLDAVSDVTSHNPTSNDEPTDTWTDSEDSDSESTAVYREAHVSLKKAACAKWKSPCAGQTMQESSLQDSVESNSRKTLLSATTSDSSHQRPGDRRQTLASQLKGKLLTPSPRLPIRLGLRFFRQ